MSLQEILDNAAKATNEIITNKDVLVTAGVSLGTALVAKITNFRKTVGYNKIATTVTSAMFNGAFVYAATNGSPLATVASFAIYPVFYQCLPSFYKKNKK